MKSRRRYGAGPSACRSGSDGPAWAGGLNSSRIGPSPIQLARQPSAGSSSTSNRAGSLHFDATWFSSQTRTCQVYRPARVSGWPWYWMPAWSLDGIRPLSQAAGPSSSRTTTW